MNQNDLKITHQLVYALGEHPYLGYLIEPHVVQLNPNGSLSFTHKRVFSNTIQDYVVNLDDIDKKIIKLLDEIDPAHLIKKHHKKAIRPSDFFTQIFDKKIFEFIRPKIELKIAQALSLIGEKPIFSMSKDGYPADKELHMAKEAASVLFHFRRKEGETRYFPTIKYAGQRIEFMFKDALIIVNQPAWMLLGQVLYYFDQPLEGKKLSPFLNKRYISVPKSTEFKYFEMFVCGLIEKHHVYAEGFDIKTLHQDPETVLVLDRKDEGEQHLSLQFNYGPYSFSPTIDSKITVRMQYDEVNDHYTFYRIRRALSFEQDIVKRLDEQGFKKQNGLFSSFVVPDNESVFSWIQKKSTWLDQENIQIQQSNEVKQYFFGKQQLTFAVKEHNDWFDLEAIAHFGHFEIPFISLREHILNGVQEFVLPNGQIALIPQEWFAQFAQFFQFSRTKTDLSYQKHHFGLLDELSEQKMLSMDRKLEALSEFEGMKTVSAPKRFLGSLRPYQEAGYQWLGFLKNYNFGGCLADDMGLGKTIQTLAWLQHEKEEGQADNLSRTSLIIMPTSLIYNWQREALQFAPDLRILVHTGLNRTKSVDLFSQFDLVITTYGTARMDASILQKYYFHYLVLDESQQIKNPSSKAFKVIRSLKSAHKLFLSGTPIENSVNDLWSQMSILNPGLLGGFSFFQEQFANPIEKKKDEVRAQRLQTLLKPFILRRTKNQVASELPSKSEQVIYCSMSEEQNHLYEKVKSEYRNLILQSLENGESSVPQFSMLQGLTKLRQLANHPRMLDDAFEGESGKFDAVMGMLENVLQKGNKILIFSQFVKQLQIFKEAFDELGHGYAYLDGSTRNRGEVVDQFRQDPDIRIFLISIKAGGVGLNLVEADYVFILDPWWNPAVEKQAIDRTHRIGQTRNVFIYRFISVDTVEEKIMTLQERKLEIAESLITTEEGFFKSLSAADIRDILS